ncbi:hypothetical protein C5167_027849 [Papaver somniferum]|uniref:hydroquinone glucosyltransferase-like n=1 Tax=Papaver somniferum TaxID=3469 RepID=UPI000E704297|nr:hydroquinone glucosyltransferase-like [Papaver somniferum]RZC91798.1 hypothetical protein C5167_027849 [Papaver somniferum]
MEGEIYYQTKRLHIVMFPTPGMGHLIPITELAKQLIHHHKFSITLIIPSTGTPSAAMKFVLNGLPEAISYILLSPVNLDDQLKDAKGETRISIAMVRSLPYLREELIRITSSQHVAAFVIDLFGTDAFDVAKEFGIPPYIFFPCNANVLQLILNLSSLHESYSGEFKDLPQPLRLPGCVPIPGPEILAPLQDKTNDAYKWFLHHARRYGLAEGILVNTFVDLESRVLKVLMAEKQPGIPTIYPVGPLTRNNSIDKDFDDASECLKWLDNQPPESVLFVSFGSGGILSYEQIIELAYGLEMSAQIFLWVIKCPRAATVDASFSKHTSTDPFDFLPDGYVDRITGSGFLVPSWAPQIQILNHGSTGGFLSHSGWNSTLESIVCGVPMITWPLYAEQKMNVVMLVEDIGVAVRPKPDGNGLIGREEISRVVKALMMEGEGKILGNKIRELKDGADRVLSENGSSNKSLLEVVNKWKQPYN